MLSITNVETWNGSYFFSFGEPSTRVFLNIIKLNTNIIAGNFTWKIKHLSHNDILIVKPIILEMNDNLKTAESLVYSGPKTFISPELSNFTDVIFSLGNTKLIANKNYAIGITTVDFITGIDLNDQKILSQYAIARTFCNDCYTGMIVSNAQFSWHNNPTNIFPMTLDFAQCNHRQLCDF